MFSSLSNHTRIFFNKSNFNNKICYNTIFDLNNNKSNNNASMFETRLNNKFMFSRNLFTNTNKLNNNMNKFNNNLNNFVVIGKASQLIFNHGGINNILPGSNINVLDLLERSNKFLYRRHYSTNHENKIDNSLNNYSNYDSNNGSNRNNGRILFTKISFVVIVTAILITTYYELYKNHIEIKDIAKCKDIEQAIKLMELYEQQDHIPINYNRLLYHCCKYANLKLYKHVFKLAEENGAIVPDDYSGDLECKDFKSLYKYFVISDIRIPNKVRRSDIIEALLRVAIIKCQYEMFMYFKQHITEKSYRPLLLIAIKQKDNEKIIDNLLCIDHCGRGKHLLNPEIFYKAIEYSCYYDRPEYIKMLMKLIDNFEIECHTWYDEVVDTCENIDFREHPMNKDLKYGKIFKFIGKYSDFKLLQFVIDRSESRDPIYIGEGVREAYNNGNHTMVNKLLGMMPIISERSQNKSDIDHLARILN